MLAYCGIDCEKCGAFIAAKNNDQALRVKTAAEWSKTYNSDIKPADISCAGCTAPGVKFHYCVNICEIRKCGAAKKVKNCGGCDTYPCGKLQGFFAQVPEAKTNLDKMRQ